MVPLLIDDTNLTSVANAIRNKSGVSGNISFPDGFISTINNISTGGGGEGSDVAPFSQILIKKWTPTQANTRVYTVPPENRSGLSFILMFCKSTGIANNEIHSIYSIVSPSYEYDSYGQPGGACANESYGISNSLASYDRNKGELGEDNGNLSFRTNQEYIVILGYGV